jgi:hypothetical protein
MLGLIARKPHARYIVFQSSCFSVTCHLFVPLKANYHPQPFGLEPCALLNEGAEGSFLAFFPWHEK